ncbi:P-loop containing nucleoside triphosphate hydrolase protein [Venturia nashicola]|uniref:DNA repair protein RAD51 homolog 3 n=1 Tax=Venturia nashicola TaxID=86259 RepID=A0A4Z1PM94_9PEZI|nr:P-loop containing nucleoside triphosphate hydrolase protein [Venturia nashicola]TLD36298.1 P-loop containing nucleoside triphosphate hydrolase protein [Venturia nashicola]
MASQASQAHPSSSSHRLPTVSASTALQKLRDSAPNNISTGLPTLNTILAGKTANHANNELKNGGLVPGQITEVYGPPGVGKTAFCMQASVSALSNGDGVVWIDAATPFPSPRFERILQAQIDSDPAFSNGSIQELHSRFKHYTIPTLAHLLALFLHPMPNFPPAGTSLIVIESISTLFDNAYHRTNADRSKTQTDAQKWAAGRKFAVMGELITKLSRMANLNGIAILITNQTVTRVRSGQGALLLPAISGSEWDNGVSTQLVLFRDWAPKQGSQLDKEETEKWHRLRYAGVIKVKGVAMEENGRFDTVVPFSIEQDGLFELSTSSSHVAVPILSSPARPTKRTFEEVADSEDEALSDDDYGWDDEDELAAGLIKSDERPLTIHSKKRPTIGCPEGIKTSSHSQNG